MSEHALFHKLQESFRQLADAPLPQVGLPIAYSIRENLLFYENGTTLREDCPVFIRDDGPDAWGYQVKIPAGSYYRRGNWEQWQQAPQEHNEYLWLTVHGSVVDVITPHGILVDWTRYIAHAD